MEKKEEVLSVIYLDVRTFEEQLDLHKKMESGVQSILAKLKDLGLNNPSIEHVAKLQNGANHIVSELLQNEKAGGRVGAWSLENYRNHLQSQVELLRNMISTIPKQCLGIVPDRVEAGFSVAHYELNTAGEVILSPSFIEDLKATYTVFADTEDRIQVLKMTEDACKALNDLQSYLLKLSAAGCFGYNSVYLQNHFNMELVKYDYDKEVFEIDYSGFRSVGVARYGMRTSNIVSPK